MARGDENENSSFLTNKTNPVGYVVSGTQQFAKDSYRLLMKCTKPDRNEMTSIGTACAIGFLIMGLIGFLIKLLFIPINNIILGN
mmetsp:Transcript_15732/g.17509  ORF Transcript_15732/g.17509 Transcript_15732/m.17509 type:complete len:85 (+) Transcript_15732:156-410(+)